MDEEAVTRTGRALDSEPLCHGPNHASEVADLVIPVRQSHANVIWRVAPSCVRTRRPIRVNNYGRFAAVPLRHRRDRPA